MYFSNFVTAISMGRRGSDNSIFVGSPPIIVRRDEGVTRMVDIECYSYDHRRMSDRDSTTIGAIVFKVGHIFGRS